LHNYTQLRGAELVTKRRRDWPIAFWTRAYNVRH